MTVPRDQSQTINPRRDIPAVQKVLRAVGAETGIAPVWLHQAAREVLESVRRDVMAGQPVPSMEILCERVESRARALARPHLRPVINATGVLIHTNLGRAPLPPEMMEHLATIATHYSTLEYRLDEGVRGSRHEHVEGLLAAWAGTEAAMVVNNNAAAVLLALSTLAKDREVIVSRGELVEIGGSFRIPEVMALSGAQLVEVGATNKTHRYDYQRAISDRTGLLLKVHQSNFRQIGFVDSVSRGELVQLGREYHLPVMEDLGSGVLLPLTIDGQEEPTVSDVIAQGVDITTFSGDKLLGGPQAGLVVGRREWIQAMKKNPLARAVRVDKMTLAVLELVLRWYHEDRGRDLPLWRMIDMPIDTIYQRAESLRDALVRRVPRLSVSLVEDFSEVGGGSVPGTRLKTWVLAIDLPGAQLVALEQALRQGDWPVIARAGRGRLLLDLRCVLDGQEVPLLNALIEALAQIGAAE